MGRISPITIVVAFSALSFSAVAAPHADFTDNAKITKPTQIWTEPTQFGTPIARLDPGLSFEVLTYSTTKSWVKIKTPEGREGWVPVRFTSYVTGDTTEEVAEAPAPVDASVAQNLPVEAEGGSRGLASVEEADRSPASKPAKRTPSAAGGRGNFLLGVHTEYVNQLSRAKASGFGIGVSGMAHVSERWAFGGGVDYQVFFESATALAPYYYTVDRVSHSIFPHLSAAFLYRGFSLEAGLGVDFDITQITSKNTSVYPNVIDPANTGRDTSWLVGLTLMPAYRFQLSGSASLGVHLLYQLLINMSTGVGPFPSVQAASKTQSVFGAGATAAFDL